MKTPTMKTPTIAAALIAVMTLGACASQDVAPNSDGVLSEDEVGALIFGVGAMAICVQTGACVPI
jgi:hypothetical protein